MNLKALRQRCDELLRDIEIPDPFDVRILAETIARRRGRPIRLHAKPSPLGPCGLWLALPDADYVFYETATSRLHRDHIIVHELAHLLAAHEPTDHLDPDLLRSLLPNLDSAMVQRVLARSTYTAVEEQEAEMIATLVLHHAERRPAARDDDAPAASGEVTVIDRLSSTLGGIRSDRRGR
ncbi:MAG: hypothetical protein JNL54_21955 [Kineosporiaceae bacterium]|nr:hypothetical protein [Kineosporiaceae bacterium]